MKITQIQNLYLNVGCKLLQRRGIPLKIPATLAGIHNSPKCVVQKYCRLFVQSNRQYSSGSSLDDNPDWSFDVKPFGKLSVKSGPYANIHIGPINPQKYPMQNKAFVKLIQGDGQRHFTCEVSPENEIKFGNGDIPQAGAVDVLFQLPVKFEVDVSVEGERTVHISRLESEGVRVKIDQGECHLNRLLGRVIDVTSKGGNVNSDSHVQGNITVKSANQGNLKAEKILGLSLDIQTEAGNIDLNAIYADKSKITSSQGNISIKSCHRDAEVEISNKGNLNIGSQDGNLSASVNDGDVDVYLVQPEKVSIKQDQGNVVVKLGESLCCQAELSAPAVELNDQVMLMDNNEEKSGGTGRSGTLHHLSCDDVQPNNGRSLKVHSQQGRICVQGQDWLSSLNLMTHMD